MTIEFYQQTFETWIRSCTHPDQLKICRTAVRRMLTEKFYREFGAVRVGEVIEALVASCNERETQLYRQSMGVVAEPVKF